MVEDGSLATFSVIPDGASSSDGRTGMASVCDRKGIVRGVLGVWK